MARPPQPCPACGGTRHESVGEDETRSVECGLTARSSVLTLRPGSQPVMDEEARRHVAQAGALLEGPPPFPVYCLDRRWTGERSFCGHGGSDGRVDHITLCHGRPLRSEGSLVQVTTRRARIIGGLTVPPSTEFERRVAAGELVHQLWSRTGSMGDDVRAAAFPAESGSDPTGPWDEVELTVDGSPLPFRWLGEPGEWVALGVVGELVVSVEATGWPLDATGLTQVEDLQPYRDGWRDPRRPAT